MKFRKKPVVIDAIEFTDQQELVEFAAVTGKTVDIGYETIAVVQTDEGNMEIQPGDYLIRGVEGEIYPCRRSVFDATYEAAE
jgi:hypothetical protein